MGYRKREKRRERFYFPQYHRYVYIRTDSSSTYNIQYIKHTKLAFKLRHLVQVFPHLLIYYYQNPSALPINHAVLACLICDPATRTQPQPQQQQLTQRSCSKRRNDKDGNSAFESMLLSNSVTPMHDHPSHHNDICYLSS